MTDGSVVVGAVQGLGDMLPSPSHLEDQNSLALAIVPAGEQRIYSYCTVEKERNDDCRRSLLEKK